MHGLTANHSWGGIVPYGSDPRKYAESSCVRYVRLFLLDEPFSRRENHLAALLLLRSSRLELFSTLLTPCHDVWLRVPTSNANVSQGLAEQNRESPYRQSDPQEKILTHCMLERRWSGCPTLIEEVVPSFGLRVSAILDLHS